MGEDQYQVRITSAWRSGRWAAMRFSFVGMARGVGEPHPDAGPGTLSTRDDASHLAVGSDREGAYT